MNLRTTLVLILLAAGGGLAWWLVPMALPKPADPNGLGSPTLLDKSLTRQNLHEIVVHPGPDAVVLEKGASGNWALKGQWPTRKAEAEELVDLITGLHSRFAVIPLSAGEDLTPFGLDPSQKPVRVEVKADAPYWLDFGQPDATEGDPFATPTYVRINDRPEVVRLGPDLLVILKRPREFYQRRQLFPDVERFKIASAPPPPMMPGMPPPPDTGGVVAVPRVKALTLEGPRGTVRVSRLKDPPVTDSGFAVKSDPQLLAEQWAVSAPASTPKPPSPAIPGLPPEPTTLTAAFPADRPDPDRLKALLGAVPDLWAEGFVASPDVAKTGLDKPEYTLKATLATGDAVTLLIGKVSQTKERPGQPPPARPGMPPMPAIPIREEYRYARLDGQDQVFEVKADKLNDLFPAPATLRDEKLARFKSFDVTKVEIKQPAAAPTDAAKPETGKAGSTIVLTKEKDERRGDKWRVLQPMQALGEGEKITELLDKLAALDTRGPDVIDNADLKKEGFDPAKEFAVTLSIDEEIPGPGEEKVKRQRTVAFTFGKHDASLKKATVRVAGRSLVASVPDDALTLAERPALTYRGRRVLDFDSTAVAKIDVQREKEKISLQQTDSEWKLTAPVAAPVDKFKAGDLASELGRLEAVEYVNDAPKPDDLAKAGLDKPALTATVTFVDGKAPQAVLIGKQREGKQDYYARLAEGGSIFAVKKEFRESLDKDSLAYRPSQLWTLTANDISDVKITRAGTTYELKKDAGDWKIVAPFDAKASFALAQPILDAIASPKLSGFQAHTAANPAEFGLDKPVVEIAFTATEKGRDDDQVSNLATRFSEPASLPGKMSMFGALTANAADQTTVATIQITPTSHSAAITDA